MKKLYKKLNLFEKLGICAVILTLIISSLPYLTKELLKAEIDYKASIILENETADTKRLSISTSEASYNKVVLYLDDKEQSRSTITVDKPAVFYVNSTGTYKISILNAQDKEVETQTIDVAGFNQLKIESMEGSTTWKIISTLPGTDHFIISCLDTKWEAAVKVQKGTSYEGEFTPSYNGTYTIMAVDQNNDPIKDPITYEVFNLQDPQEKPQEPADQDNDVIHINNEAELKKIDDHPEASYVLDRDIIITDETSEFLVSKTFTGTLQGNGYQIKGLTQPVFASIKDAVISNVSLQGAWKNKEGALLALSSEHSTYTGIAVNAELEGKEKLAGMLLKANKDTITKSYVSGYINGKQTAGFFLEGTGTIEDSYVSGMVKAEDEATGFAKDAVIKNAYLSATVTGKDILLFNQEKDKEENLIDCYYDINLQEMEELRATPLTTDQITDGEWKPSDAFQPSKGAYPSIKQDKEWSESAQKSEALSLMALPLTENIHGITEDISLPKTSGDEKLEWTNEGKNSLSKNTLEADVQDDMDIDTSGTLMARSSYGVKLFATGSAKALERSPMAGQSLAEKTTQISFNATAKKYYIIRKKTDETPTKPASHKEAIEAGWKRYLWDGIINWSNLEWNTDYVLYEYDMSIKDNTQLTSTEIKTNQGLIGGSVTLSNDNAVGTEITATLSDDALIKEGSWTWERSKSLSSKNWEQITGKASIDTNSLTSTYTPETTDAGYYIRATFQVSPNQSFTGSVSETTSTVIRKEMVSVKIQKNQFDITNENMVVGTLLSAALDPVEFETEITYYWYHEDDSNTIMGTGKQYLLTGKDVDKKIYVKAVAKSDGSAIGEVKSDVLGPVQKAVNPKPTSKIEIVNDKTTDISITVKLPDSVNSGLYQFAYLKDGESTDKRVEYEAYTRGHNPIEIRGLESNTQYYFYVRQLGENGYADSEWCDEIYSVAGKTDLPHLVGTIKIEGDPIYDVLLNSTLENGVGGQTYQNLWYRIDADGNRLTTSPIGTARNYKPKQADIGYRLEVEYKGYGEYAGTITAQTEEIRKAEVHAPYNGMDESKCSPIDDATIRLVLPESDDAINGLTANEKFIIGYSTTSGGIPIEYREGTNNEVKIFEPSTSSTTQTVDLTGFQRNTTYYFFLRYAEQPTHFKSDWSAVESCIQITTKQTPLGGSISFAYQTNDYPVQKDKLTAFIRDTKTTLGTWKWTEISPDKQTQTNMNNFFPDGADKTYIMIPESKPAGTTYKVEFIPESGYSGLLSLTSEEVVEFKTEPYPVLASVPVASSKSDTTLTFKMSGSNLTDGAIYEFRYGTSSNVNDAGNFTSPLKAYKETDVTITGLNRNTLYHIWVRRAGDDVHSASDWTSATLDMTTELTDLHGYVTIEETPVAGVTLSATYVQATYNPQGDDTEKYTWQWYRENTANEFQAISGANAAVYTPSQDDIGKRLKAVYTGGGDFKSSKEMITAQTLKLRTTNPTIDTLTQGADTAAGYLTISAENVDTNETWYQLKNSNDNAPQVPTAFDEAGMKDAGWTKVPSANFNIDQDSNKKYLTPQTNYTLYIMRKENATTQPSSIVPKNVIVGNMTQKGTITITGNAVVGNKLTATLDGNNNQGTWKWYLSNTVCADDGTTAIPTTDLANWTQIGGGYEPTINSKTSMLTITPEMWKHSIMAVFVGDDNQHYEGTITSTPYKFVRKVFEESLSVSGSGYSGKTIQIKINNMMDSSSRNVRLVFKDTDKKINAKATSDPSVYEAMIPLHGDYYNSTYHTKYMYAEMDAPSTRALFVDSSLNDMGTTIDCKTTSEIQFHSGIPISNPDDLAALINGDETYLANRYGFKTETVGGYNQYYYTDSANAKTIVFYRDNIQVVLYDDHEFDKVIEDCYWIRKGKYILTDNIDLKGKSSVGSMKKFGGELDADYHTVMNLGCTLFYSVMGNASIDNYAQIKNLILKNVNFTTTKDQRYFSGMIAATGGHCLFKNILLVDATLSSPRDAGMLLGYLNKLPVSVEECGAANGAIIGTDTGTNAGFAAVIAQGSVVKNSFLVKSSVSFPEGQSGGMIGRIEKPSYNWQAGSGTVENVYFSGTLNAKTVSGAVVLKMTSTSNSMFYDSNYYTTSTNGGQYGWPKTTQEMLNTGLKTSFGGDSNTNWVYRPGFYPRLRWTMNEAMVNSPSAGNIATLYAATPGAFLPTGNTSPTADELTKAANGQLYGSVNIPEDFQKEGFTITSNNSNLTVVNNTTIVPTGAVGSTGTITVKYAENASDTPVTSTFDFTVKQQASAITALNISGNTTIGSTLTARATGGAGHTYQWYRRKKGSTEKEIITGQTGSTYVVQPKDTGYEIAVDAKGSNTAMVSSKFTSAVTAAQISAVNVTEKTDTSITIQAVGGNGLMTEYAYAMEQNGTKIIAGQTTSDTFTLSGLQRNKDYYLYARISKTDSYEAGEWSPVKAEKTAKTALIGNIQFSNNINMEQTMTISVSDTNLQTGDWKLERVDDSGNVVEILTPTPTSNIYSITYILTKQDAGYYIRATFTGNGNFEQAITKTTDRKMLKKAQDAPRNLPQEVTADTTDKSFTIKEPTEAAETGITYQFGYSEKLSDEPTVINEVGVDVDTPVKVDNPSITRNKTYYVSVRKAERDDYEPSPWFSSIQISTKRTEIKDNTMTVEGETVVDKKLTFTVNNKDDNTVDQRGIWILERVSPDNKVNTLLPEEPSPDTHSIAYQLVPEDSGNKIRAKYLGAGDYTGEIIKETETIQNASQSIGSTIPSVYASGYWKEYSIDAQVDISLGEASDIYEFGYRKKGSADSIMSYPVTVTRGNVININPVDVPLTRNTAYEIYVRKAEKIGYNASDWSDPAVDSGTSKTMLTGNITFTGDVAVNETITVNYEPGSYPNSGDDTGGTWKWYLGDDPDPVSTSTSYTIPPTEGNPDLRVEYIPAENSGFTQNVTRTLGTVKKAPYQVPAAAEVTAMDPDNANEGSVLHLVNKDVDPVKNDIYIYLKEATDDVLPALQTVSEVTDPVLSDKGSENINRWILAESTMDVRVPANRSYVVYSARLESKTNKASEISSARGTLSKKEPLKRSNGSADGFIRESDETVVWKALQEKTLEYSLYGKAPTAIWKYYVAKKPDDPNQQFNPITAVWQSIDAELKDNGRQDVRDEQKGVYTSTISTPMKYTDYYIKAVLKGTDDYEGEVEYISKAPLEGTMIDQKGAVLIKGDTTKLLDILVAKYTATDDETGTFTWYRETAAGSNQYEAIGKPTNGTESSYQTVREDYNKHIYAVYTASPKSTYSGSSQTNAVLVSEKAEQETPSMVEKVQVNGNSVQVTIPENYKKENMDKIPRVIIGYQKTDESGNPLNDSQIVWQINDKIGNNWVRNLDRYSYYVFYAKFEGTELYAASDISAKTNPPVKTENDLFDEGNLSITSKMNDSTRNASDIGNGIHVTYTGDGYDEGYFSLKRSNGEVINTQVAASPDSGTKSISFDYTYTYEDIGNNIIVEYTAKDEAKHYDGTISKSNGVIVTKPESKETAETPTMKRGLDTDLLVEIKDGYEYCLDTSASAPAADSGDWNILEANKADEPGYHDFLRLERTTTYYLHARIAETKETQASEAVTSTGMTPEPYIDMGAGHTEDQIGKIEIDKTKGTAPASGSGDKITFPYTLNPGTVTLSDMKFIRQSDGTVVTLEGVDTFVNANGTASDAVYEWGSDKANERFAADLQMYDANGNLIDSSTGTKTELKSVKDGSMQLTIYRANGVDKGGTYIWEAMLKDSEGKTALLRSEVTFITNIDMVVPIRIDMYLEGGKYIKQNTNIASLHNQIYLPVVIGVDKQARVVTDGVPALKGLWKDGTVPVDGEAYLKISNDGTNYTAPWNSVWLNTGRSESKIIDLLALGHNARGGYYVSGIASETQDWPWVISESGVNEIPQAYGIKFVTQISPKDIRIETRNQLDFKDLEE